MTKVNASAAVTGHRAPSQQFAVFSILSVLSPETQKWGCEKSPKKKDNRPPSRNLEVGCFFGIIDI